LWQKLKDMRKIVYGSMIALLGSSLFSCGGGSSQNETYKFESNGKVPVKNGKGEIDSVEYSCLGCDSLITEQRLFTAMVNKATEEVKDNLNFPLTFVPKKIKIIAAAEENRRYYDTDSLIENLWWISVTYDYIANNAYNTPISGDKLITFYILDGKIQKDFDEKLKLDELKFNEDGIINRELIATRDDSYLSVTPYYDNKMKDFNLIIKSSHTCVDYRAELMINFKDKSKYSLYSWNDFNCDPVSYFTLTKKDFNAIAEKPVESIGLYSRGDLVMCWLDKNQVDYFIQLAKLGL
jgi:hypothetical protein